MAGGFFSSAGLFGTGGSPAQVVTTSPYDQMVQGGQSGNFNDLANTNSTYLADMYSQLGTGRAPSYYQSYQNQALPYRQGLNAQNFFGTSGNRSTNMWGAPTAMGQAASNAAMFGWNPKAQAAQMSKVGQQYQNMTQQIDDYFAGQGLNTIQDMAKGLPGWAAGQQDALSQAFHPYTNVIPAQAGTTGFVGDALTTMFNSMWGGGGGGGMPGGGGGGMSGYTGGQNAGYMAQPYMSGPMSLSQGGSGFASAPMMMGG